MGQIQPIEAAAADELEGDELEPGHKLMQGQYTIEKFLSSGGFGITYLAKNSLNRRVVIKECFPGAYCRRQVSTVMPRSRAQVREYSSIVSKFVAEAHSLAKIQHPNVVGVHEVFEENKTAYMALDYVEGRELLEVIDATEERLEPGQIETILKKLLGALGSIHVEGMLHRDISPDNILLGTDMEPVLIDFGAAREAAGKEDRALSELRVVKDGYSPQEFYVTGAEQGPSSDLYALAATFYQLITGELPVNAQERLSAAASGTADPYVPLAGRTKGYSAQFLMAIDKAMNILPKDRIASAELWLAAIDSSAGTGADMLLATPGRSPAAPSEAPALATKKKSRLLAGLGLAIPIIGGAVFLQLNGGAPSDQGTAGPSAGVAATQGTESTGVAATADSGASGTSAAETDLIAALNLQAPAGDTPVTTGASSGASPAGDSATGATDLAGALGLDPAPASDSDGNSEVVAATPPQSSGGNGDAVFSSLSIDLPEEIGTIYAINDIPLDGDVTLDSVLRQAIPTPVGAETELSILAGASPDAATTQVVTVPVVQRTTSPDGAVFETRLTNDAWITRVVETSSNGDLELGDILIGDLQTAAVFDQRTSLADALAEARDREATLITVAVRRGDFRSVASIAVPK